MQPTETQVEQSLAALRQAQEPAVPRSVDDAVAEGEVDGLPAEVLERILALPSVRQDRLSSAMLAVAEGRVPDAGTLADKMVGRLVCDRLR